MSDINVMNKNGKTLIASYSKESCKGCFFESVDCDVNLLNTCRGNRREDGKSIIWIEQQTFVAGPAQSKKTAPQLLTEAAEIMNERTKDYDKPDGERSMARCVAAFNAITGHDMTEQEGWLLMQILKDVRQFQNPGRVHVDRLLDGIAYSALKAESFGV